MEIEFISELSHYCLIKTFHIFCKDKLLLKYLLNSATCCGEKLANIKAMLHNHVIAIHPYISTKYHDSQVTTSLCIKILFYETSIHFKPILLVADNFVLHKV